MNVRAMDNLENYIAIADSIARLYYPHAEVIIHDARTRAILHVTGRPEGINSRFHHKNSNCSTEQIRSITSVLKNDEGEPEVVLCISVNFSALDTALATLTQFLMPRQSPSRSDALFRDDCQRRITTFTSQWLSERNLSPDGLSRQDRSLLVEALYNAGAFEGRYAAEVIACVLKVSRTTIFNQLKTLRKSIQPAAVQHLTFISNRGS